MRLFTATWCQPCTNLKQWLKEQGMSADIEIIDIDEKMELASEVGVTGIPALQVDDSKDLLTTNERIRPFLLEYYER